MSIDHDDESIDTSQEGNDDVIDIKIQVPTELQKASELSNTIQSSYAKMMAPVTRQQELIDSMTKSTRLIASGLSEAISESIQPYYRQLALSMSTGLGEILKGYRSEALESMIRMVNSYQFDFSSILSSSVQQMLSQIDFSSMYSALAESIKSIDFSKRINALILSETYSAKWFPHALSAAEGEVRYDFLEILESTRKSQSRIKKIDKLIFDYYTKSKIEALKKTWKRGDIPEYKYRVMHQAVQAYHRKEYAITVTVLSTIWEGLIYDKAKDTSGKKGKVTKQNFSKLVSNDDYDQIFADFFDEYIMYDCRSDAEVKEDVPGRNSSAHSFYNKYPSRKAALNAILFTDFLVKLESLNIENNTKGD